MEFTKERDNFVYIAKLAEQAERYDEMVDSMKKVANLDVELTVEERNLLSVGYKNVIDSRRASWRILSSMEQKEESKGNEHHVKRIDEYRQKIESELSSICNDFMQVIDEHLVPSSSAGESTVFYYKMKGDYYRYLAEFKAGNEKKEAAEQSLKAYEKASTTAEGELSPTHPIRLGLALSFSVFYKRHMNSPERGCHLAKQAFDEAISELDTLSEESYKDSTSIMQVLRDNLSLWTSDIPEDGGGLPPVTFGENGQPIGDNSVQLSSKIGEVVRTYVSPIYLKWTDVPNELKELVWEIVSHSFEVPEYSKRFILKKANNSWKDWKSKLRLKVLNKYQTDVERKSNIPEGVKKEDWESFVELNSTSQAHSIRQKGKAARKALKCPHTSGRKGQAQVAAELSQQNPDSLVTRTQVYLATHGRKDGATGNQYLDEIDNLIQRDPTIVEKDLNHDPVALALGRDNRGRVRGLGMGVSKRAVHHSTPYRRYEMASQAAIKTAVDELKEQNIQLRERLEEESRERKRMEKRILSCLSQGHVVMQPSTDNGSSSQVRRDLPPQDARSCRLMHLTRKSTCIAYGRVMGLSTEEEECYKVIVDEIIKGSVELIGGGKSFQDLTLGDTIDWAIFRTTFV